MFFSTLVLLLLHAPAMHSSVLSAASVHHFIQQDDSGPNVAGKLYTKYATPAALKSEIKNISVNIINSF